MPIACFIAVKSDKETDNSMKKLALSDEILLTIQQPARYLGNEMNVTVKDPDAVDIRFCMCFPDVYKICIPRWDMPIS